jgi:hypothetical protein
MATPPSLYPLSSYAHFPLFQSLILSSQPNGHAFILRRLDTGAISLTTMFRAAFPTASDVQEKVESTWVRANYELEGANKSGKARFAGTWVSEDTAKQLAPAYLLQSILVPLLEAVPDPNVEYRKSARTQQDTPTSTRQLPTPSPSLNNVPSPVPTPSATKRRREAPPEPSPAPSPAPVKTPVKGTPARLGTRRSARMASPAPTPVPQLVSPKTPRSPRKQQQVATSAGSDETAVEEEEALLGGPDMSRDIEEQQEMIESFKAQRAAQRAAEDADALMVDEGSDGSDGRKREREEDAPPAFSFKEPEQIAREQEEGQSRALVSNRRVRGIQMTPQRRSLAWGVGFGAVAAAAIAYLPLNLWF